MISCFEENRGQKSVIDEFLIFSRVLLADDVKDDGFDSGKLDDSDVKPLC